MKIIAMVRRYCAFCILLGAGISIYAQSVSDTADVSASAVSTADNTTAAYTAHETEHSGSRDSGDSTQRPLDTPIRVSDFKIISQYYGLPLSVRFGWFYRDEDLTVFPNAGISFSVTDTPVLDTSIGLAIQKKSFFWSGYAVYDLIPFTMHKKNIDQIVYGITSFGFSFYGIKVTMPLLAGRMRQNEVMGNGANPVTRLTAVTQLSAGVQLDFFLTDLGFFKSTGTAAFYYHWIPQAVFHYYTVSAAIPASFHLYYVDIAWMYSFYHTSAIQYDKMVPIRSYAIGQSQSGMTGRSSFKTQVLFKDIHLFSTELRWYPARITAQTNGFFLSLFADTGFGITEWGKRSLLYEFGSGLGYNLYDSVPLTFQAGVNQELQPVFYLSVVSRLSHRP